MRKFPKILNCLLISIAVFISTGTKAQINNVVSKNKHGQQVMIKSKLTKVTKNHLLNLPNEYLFIQCGLQDKKGNMWFGSAGDGIYFYNGKDFTNITFSTDLNLNDILSILEDKRGTIWFGTRRGLIQYQASGEQASNNDFKTILISSNIYSRISQKKIPETFEANNNMIWSMLQDNTGIIWFGTSKGVFLHNPLSDSSGETPIFFPFLEDKKITNIKKLQLNEVTDLLQDKKGNIWFVSAFAKAEGITLFDGKNLSNFKPDNISSFRAILERKNGNLLFLSSFHGLYVYNGKTFRPISEKIGFKNDTLLAMLEDRHENLWFGTNNENKKKGEQGGVIRYNNKSSKIYSTKDGLPNSSVFCLIEDRDANIWFGTRNTGLCRYNGKTFTNFTD